jgi:hypothetical protein
MLRDFVGGRTGGLVFCKPDGCQLMQRDILKYKPAPHPEKTGGLNKAGSTSFGASALPN